MSIFMNLLKHFFVVPKKFGFFMLTMENLYYKNESGKRKYLKMQKNQFLKVKNSLELEHIELKYIEVKIKRDKIIIF